MASVAFILCAVLAAISAVHFYWAFGGLWPGHDEKSLAKTVIGSNDVSKMPPAWLTGVVAVGIFVAALFPLMWSGQIPYALPQILVRLGMWTLTAIFVGRGIAGYLPFFRNANSEQPFADLDQKYYSPLCLAIGAGFASLLFIAGI